MNRRDFLLTAAASPLVFAATPAGSAKLGIASTSIAGAFQGGAGAIDFLERCKAYGAAGIQSSLNGDLAKLRARAAETGMYLEGMASLPRNGNVDAFEKALNDVKAAGGNVVRVAALSGRRYETFATLEAWNQWKEQTFAALKLAVPVAERLKVSMALENHKDWTLEDYERLMKTYSSEYLGACLDFGNNIALLDDPMEVVDRLAPYAMSTHVKDMGVEPYEDGFLLSEVPLGQGILDLPRIIATIQKARPKTNFLLEMMTRDPLKVPCMTEKYWIPFPDRNGRYLARTMRMVEEHASKKPLPAVSTLGKEERLKVEDQNIKLCMKYFREKLT